MKCKAKNIVKCCDICPRLASREKEMMDMSRIIWKYDDKKKVLMFFRDIRSDEQGVFEVNVADLVIDAKTGEILELHIKVDREEERELLEFLLKRGILS